MKRWVISGLILVLILGFSYGGYYYFFRTPEGVRLVFKGITRFSSLTLSAEKIEGRIAGRLYLEGLKAGWTDGQIQIQKIQTRLNPLHLLRGKMVIEEITGSGIFLDDQKKRTEPLDLSLPKVSGLLSRLDIEVRSFSLKEITYRRPVDPTRIIEVMSGRLAWKQGILAVSPILVKGDLGRLEGALGVGFSVPAIKADIQWFPEKPWQGLEQFVVQGQLTPGWRGEQLTGPVFIKGRIKNSDRVFFQTELGITPHRINFKKISFREAGRKGSIGGHGAIHFDRTGPAFETLLNLEEVDLSREAKAAISLTGQLRLNGRPDAFSGTFDLKNKVRSWQAFHLVGSVKGKQAGLEVKVVQGEWLKGSLQGLVGITWDKEYSIHGLLQGRQLRSEVLNPHWSGLINLDVQGVFSRSVSGMNQGSLTVSLLESRFQEKTLQGEMKARYEKNTLVIEKAELRGHGFGFSGRGVLSEGLDFEAQVSDLSSLVPNSRGSVSAAGWVRWRKDLLGTRLTLKGKEIYWKGTGGKELKLEAAFDQEKTGTPVDLKVRILGFSVPSFAAGSLAGETQGTLSQHKINLSLVGSQGNFQAGLSGSFREKNWNGMIHSLSGAVPKGNPFRLQSPTALQVGPDRFQLSPLILSGNSGERILIKADLGLNPVFGNFSADWQKFDLARCRSYLGKVQLTGQTSGWMTAEIFKKGQMDLQANADLSGSFQTTNRQVGITRGGLKLAWDQQGLRSSWNLETKDGGWVHGEVHSPEKARLAFPDRGKLAASGEGIDLALINQGNISGLQTRGKIMGQVEGEWTPGTHFSLKGRLGINKGSLAWQEKGTAINSLIKKADLGFLWDEDKLRGNMNLELDGYGEISGDFNLPLPARIPLKIKPDGPVNLNLSGKVREKGLLTILFPEAVQTSRGQIQGHLSAKGTWEKPSLEGNLELTEAGADILPLGIQIKNVSAKAVFNQDQINLTSLEMQSGPGRLTGKGTFWLKDRKIVKLEGKLTGDHFQIINRPGTNALASPNLDISGTPGHLTLAGVLEIPEALLSGLQSGGFKRASTDVVLVDPSPSSKAGTGWPIYGEIRLNLGQKVRMKAEGLDAFLQGGIAVNLTRSNSIKAHGEVQISRGYYLLQNQKLEIARGRFIFNGPPENPTIDVLALRTIRGKQRLQEWVEEVKAGITITGTVRLPQVKLYSSPLLSESDILSYILFGEPLKQGAGKQDLALLSKAARILLGGKIPGKLAGLLDPDTVEIRSENGDFSRSVITVGKYLDPRLFLGLGGSLFDNSYQVILRYALTPHLEIETKGGTHSSGGIFFKVDFE